MKEKGIIINKIPIGDYTKYYRNGNLEFEFQQFKGKQKGNVKEYYENGTLKEQYTIKFTGGETEREGYYRKFDKQGHLIEEYVYNDGEEYLNVIKEYNQNGQLIFEGKYNDSPATEKMYDENGRLSMHKIFSKEKEIIKDYDYHKNGTLRFEQTAINGKIEGERKHYYDNGNIRKIGVWKNGERQSGKRYYEDGTLSLEIPYKNGKREGTGKIYYKNGDIRLEIIFLDDKPLGGYEYSLDGKKKSRSREEILSIMKTGN